MGMSASQARLIALTARMSDVEYEGQQINQQRLTLANKISDIYSQMENLTVPTPPSPLDYQITKYSGATAGGKAVEAAVQDNGRLTIGVNRDKGVTTFTTTPVGTDIPVGKGYEAGTTPISMDTIASKRTNVQVKYKPLQLLEANASTFEAYPGKITKTEKIENGQGTGEYTYTCNDMYYVANPNAEYTGLFNISASTNINSYSDLGVYGSDKVLGAPQLDFKADGIDGTLSVTEAKGLLNGYDSAAISKFTSGGYFKDASCAEGSQVTVNDFNKFGQYTGGSTQFYTKKEYTTVDNNRAFSVDQAATEFSSKSGEVAKLREAILAMEAKSGGVRKDSDMLKNWVIYGDAAGLHAVKISGDKATEYELKEDTAGTIVKTDVDISGWEADALGNIKGTVTIGEGENAEQIEVKLKKSTVSGAESDDYKDAMAKYEADKVKYDHEQKELNNQTSVWQQEDKKLDLKLKRLDTERNALNTEIDAVKKVIQDSTDKGFKTFSG